MSTPLAISIAWLYGEPTDHPEQAGQAELTIVANGICLTENTHTLEKVIRSSARLSTVHLSNWIAGNWWRLLWEPHDGTRNLEWEMAHRMAAAGGGYIWPDISFSSDWNNVLVRSSPTRPSPAEPVRYWQESSTSIPMPEFEKAIADFVTATLDRLSSKVPQYGYLGDLWQEVSEEREDPDITEWRKLEACLGHDPDEASPELLQGLRERYHLFGANAIFELAAVSKDNTLQHLEDVTTSLVSQGNVIRVPQHQEIRDNLASQTFSLPWHRGVHAATTARKTWGLHQGPVTNRHMEQVFGIDPSHPKDPTSPPRWPS